MEKEVGPLNGTLLAKIEAGFPPTALSPSGLATLTKSEGERSSRATDSGVFESTAAGRLLLLGFGVAIGSMGSGGSAALVGAGAAAFVKPGALEAADDEDESPRG
jgi:hypothetical protein